MDQYMALSKKDLQINITLNELYNTHSLILQHVDVLVSCCLFRTTDTCLNFVFFSRRMRNNTSGF